MILHFFSNPNRNYKVLLWLALTPLIHSSYWLFIAVVLGGIIVNARQKLLMILAYVSVPFSFLSSDFLLSVDIKSFLSFNSSIADWASMSLAAEMNHEAKTGGTGFYWVPMFFDTFKRIAYLLIPYLIWKRRKVFATEKNINRLFSFYLYFFIIVNFFQIFPVLGVRYSWFVQILSIYLLLVVYGSKAKKILLFLLLANSWYIFTRYFYQGAVYSSVPPIIFYTPLPYIIAHYWGVIKMNTNPLL